MSALQVSIELDPIASLSTIGQAPFGLVVEQAGTSTQSQTADEITLTVEQDVDFDQAFAVAIPGTIEIEFDAAYPINAANAQTVISLFPGLFVVPSGDAAAETFESVSRNIASHEISSCTYEGGRLTAVVFAIEGGGAITKTFVYDGEDLDRIVLSGDVPLGIATTKIFTYDVDGNLTSTTYQ